jgi:signal transduction histidine kinase
VRDVEVHSTPIFSEKGKILFSIIHDITEVIEYRTLLESKVQSEIEKRLRHEQLLIQQSKLAAMGEMISAIAHQWRQPLNAIALYLQDLVSAERSGELTREYLKESVSMTMEQINHMSRTIDDFRHFFKPTSEDESFDIADAVEESLQLFSAQLKNNEIAVTLGTASEADTTITGNSNHLRQVILNLLSNAIDAIKERKERQPGKYRGQIFLQIEAMPDRFRITVEDNGSGIEPEAIEHVFEPYFTTKEQGKGSGIGLYMSRTILQNYFGATLNLIPREEGVRAEILLPRSYTRKGARNDDAS